MLPSDNGLLDALTRFTRALADRDDVADVLYDLTDTTVEILGALAAGVSLAGEETMQFVSANSEAAAELERVQQETKQGPCHRAFVTSTAVVVDDLSVHDEWPLYCAAALEHGVHAVIGVPVVVGGATLGALNVYHGGVRAWTSDDLRVAQVLTDIATGYLLHASRMDEANRVNEQLQQALETRVAIEQAKGLLAGEHGIGVDAAFEILRNHARSKQIGLREVAEAVVRLDLRLPPLAN